MIRIAAPRFHGRALAVPTLAAGLLSIAPGPPAPGLPALLDLAERISGLPMLGLAGAAAVGGTAAWAARLNAGELARPAAILAALIAPALLPGASALGFVPALLLAGVGAWLGHSRADLRLALLIAAALVATAADQRLAAAGAVAIFAAVTRLLAGLDSAPANDNAPGGIERGWLMPGQSSIAE